MSKVLTLPNGQNSCTVYTSDGSAEVMLLGIDPSSATFASPGQLQGADVSALADNSVVSVGVINDDYFLMKNPPAGAVADGVNIIAPASPAGALLFRKYTTNQAAWLQTAWTIDPVNGNDANAGTALSPLKTARELFNRWNRGRLLQPTYTVQILAGDAGKLGTPDVELGPNTVVTISGTLSSTAPRAIATVTATNPNLGVGGTRGQITDPGGAFARGQRLRLVSGTNTGALTETQGGTTAATAVVVGWSTISNLSIPPTVEPAPGDQYVTDTYLTTLHCGGSIRLRGSAVGKIIIRDVNWTTDPASGFAEIESFQVMQSSASTIPANPQLYFVASQFDSNANPRWASGAGISKCVQCTFKSNVNVIYSACVAFEECTFQGLLTVGFQAFVQNVTRWTLDGGAFVMKNAFYESNGGIIQAGATAVGGTCWELFPGSSMYTHATSAPILWGPTSGYAVGIRQHVLTGVEWNGIPSQPSLAGSTTADAVWLLTNFTWAAYAGQASVAPVNLVAAAATVSNAVA